MKKKIDLILFIINPFICLPYTLYKMIKEKKMNIYSALSLGILGFLIRITETGDMGRIFSSLEELRIFSFQEFLTNKMLTKGDFLFYALGFSILKLEFNLKLLPFITTTIYFLGVLFVVNYSSKFYKGKKNENIYFTILLFHSILILNLFQYIGNMRYMMALGFLSFGIVLELKGKSKSFIFYIFSFLTHISLLPLIIVIYISKQKFFLKNIKIILLISFIFGLVSKNIYILILKNLKFFDFSIIRGIEKKILSYIFGEGAERAATHFVLTNAMLVYMGIIIICVFFIKEKIRIKAIASSMLCYVLINLQFKEIAYRASAATGIVGIVIISYYLSFGRKNNKLIILGLLFFTSLQILIMYFRMAYLWRIISIDKLFKFTPVMFW